MAVNLDANYVRFRTSLRDTRERRSYNVVVSDSVQLPAFRKPSAVEAFFNRAFGFPVGLGIAPGYMRLLQVRGRKTGRSYSSPVNLLQVDGKAYLVAPRGRTQCRSNRRNCAEAGQHAAQVPAAAPPTLKNRRF